MADPLVFVGAGRSLAPCSPCTLNVDVEIRNFAGDLPEVPERQTIRVRVRVRNDGSAVAPKCRVELWWSPENITGTSMRPCYAKPPFGDFPPARAITNSFEVAAGSSRLTSDLSWDVPNLSTVGSQLRVTHKLIAKLFCDSVNGSKPFQPGDPSVLPPERDPCCGVRTIKIVGV
jgi:hypothetical protein